VNTGQSILQRLLRYAVLAVFLVFGFWFLAGRNGWVSIGRRKARERQLQADIAGYRERIKEQQQLHDWLANPDTASLRARMLLGDPPDSTATPR